MKRWNGIRWILPWLLSCLCIGGCSAESVGDTVAAPDDGMIASEEADDYAWDIAENTEDDEVITLRFPLIVSGDTPDSLSQVEQAMSDYTEEKIGVRVEFVSVDMDQLENFYYMQLSAENPVDFLVMLPAEPELTELVDSGVIRSLDPWLEEYGAGIIEAAGDLLSVGQLRGNQYMIPQLKETYTMGTSIEFNARLLRKYHIDVSEIHTIEDLEPLLAKIHREEPEVTAIGVTDAVRLLSGYDDLGDTLGVLNLAADDSLTVTDWYETEEFYELASLMHHWFEAGYIDEDTLIQQEADSLLVQEGKTFCCVNTYMPTGDWGSELTEDSIVVEIPLDDQPQLLTSYQAGLEMVGIMKSCEHPQEAMEFLNLLYTDSYVVNLIQHGIEGVDYEKQEDGLVEDFNHYYLLYGQAVNQKLRYLSTDDGSEFLQEVEEYKKKNTTSPAFGFVFDQNEVAQEVMQCKTVVNAYYPVISRGCVDPETEIPKFIEALREAGIDRVIEEKQRQLSAWTESVP